MSRTFRQVTEEAINWCPGDHQFLLGIERGHIQWRKDYRLWKRLDRRNDRHQAKTELKKFFT
ncbi:hypothetical protein COT97_01785 [Candidatus Falkowbacteria bacterium CG10_big_fil_rev_8_21_14_0_10_39_11]|uniref:Uncharacterized protein n=1 Tax=Candidatus Falkowbacteria bacterium CG10_big_fil_rev_8_21_14_0_10_39_11 TaxID=1974565 RepID=A0A2H0V7K6_9BACT|nr:MAG: hypothetical protein COT97_01785 [Candidatus Falkowbacteria bacterium CG10_big_fil_rev_8_21_14_0_10_39_11]